MSNTITRRRALVGAVASATALSLATTKMALASPLVHEVKIKGLAFEPKHIHVNVGDIIKWTNVDLAPHTATADEFGWDTEEIRQSESAEIVVTEDIETTYFCVFHPHMKGSFAFLEV